MRSSRRAFASCALGIAATACGFLPISRTSRAGANILEQAPKPPPVDSAFDGCGPDGSQPDYALNRRKNRVDAGAYLAVPWTLIARLPWPRQAAYRFRNQWGSGETNQVARYEGAAVRVEGYLVGYRLEVPEPPNCYSRDDDHKDFHLWLAERPNDKRSRSIVVEITPRVRARHAGWTEDKLAALVESSARVRVAGWLMLDQMHPERVGGNRVTLWEIHPIMGLDWQREDGSWISIDDLSPATDTLPPRGDIRH